MKIDFNVFNRAEPSKVYLGSPNRKIICALGNIIEDSFSMVLNANNTSTVTFQIPRSVNGEDLEEYDKLSWLMRIYVENFGWFIMQEPSITNDGIKEIKTISAESEEIIFLQDDLKGFLVNYGTTDSMEMLVENNVEIIDGVEFAKEQIKFYREDKPELSLLHILLADNPEWKIKYVDDKPKKYVNIVDGQEVISYVQLKDEIGRFSVDNANKYAFMTQDVQQFYECILYFDYSDLTISAYRVENIGKDTNINIGFRNIQNSNSITVAEDSIYTKYTIQGSDGLDVYYVNFGTNEIEDLSHYLNSDYMSEDLINKYTEWKNFVEEKRWEYIDSSRKYNLALELISEIKNRVPLTGCSTDWNTYSDDELRNAKDAYEAQIKGYESKYVDDEGNFDINKLNKSPDANAYYQIKDVILPSINIEFENRKLPTSIGEQDYIDSYLKEWKYYGVDELHNRLITYRDQIEVYKKQHYDIPYDEYARYTVEDKEKYPAHSKEMHEANYADFLKISYELDDAHTDSCQTAFNERSLQLEQAEDALDVIQEQRLQINHDIDKNNWKMTGIDAFTKDEINLLNALYSKTDYVNNNVYVSTHDTTDQIIDEQLKLLQYATEDLSATSQPQYTYTTELDNFLALFDYEEWSKELGLFDYVWLGIRDDKVVKLRVSSLTFNPMLMNNSLTIGFTNMINSKSKRNDFISLLGLNGSSGKNSATGYTSTTNKGEGTIVEITNELLQQIVQSAQFTNKVNSMVNGQIGSAAFGSISGDYITVENLEAEMIKVVELHAENGFFEYLQAELISADKIVADSGKFKELSALTANIDSLLAGNVVAELGHIISLTAKNVTIDEAVITELIAARIAVNDLKAGTISTDKMNILSDDGGMSIVGNTMQFKDKNNIVRIQIGRDTQGEFSFVLYGADGTGVMIDQNGIKESSIADGLIKSEMVGNQEIKTSNIDFESFGTKTDELGNLIMDVGKIEINGENFQVKYEQFIEDTNTSITGVETKVNAVDKSITDKVWRTDIVETVDKDGNIISDELINILTQAKTDISGITSTVSKTNSYIGYDGTGEITKSLTEQISENQQTFEGFKQTVETTYTTEDAVNGLITESEKSVLEQTSSMISASIVDNVTGANSALQIELGSIKTSIEDAEGNISNVEQTVNGLSTTVSSIEGDITTVNQTVSGLSTKVENVEGNMATVNQTVDGLTTRVENAEGTVSQMEQSVNGLTLKVENAEGDISALEQTVDNFKIEVSETYATEKEVSSAIDGIQIGGRNLFVRYTTIDEHYLDINATEVADELWGCTDYISIDSNQEYIVSGASIYGGVQATCFYGENKEFLSSIVGIDRQFFTTPTASYFMKFSFLSSDYTTLKIEKGNKITDYTKAPEDEEYENLTEYGELRSQIESTADSILLEVSATHYTKDETQTQINEKTSNLELTADNLTASFTELQQELDDTNAKLDTEITNINTYFDFSADGLTIGKNTSPIQIKIINDRMSFVQNGKEVAYISNENFGINHGIIYESLDIGNFGWQPRQNGSLSFDKLR